MGVFFLLVRRKVFSKYDFFVAGGLLLILVAFRFFTSPRAEGPKYAEITRNGRVEAEIALSEERRYRPEASPGVEIAVENGTVGFVRSDCPDKICVHAGFFSTPGRSAVCLPNRIVVRVVTRVPDADEVDSIVY